MDNLILKNITKLNHLFSIYKVKKAYVFGSVLTSSFKSTSDLDFVIQFQNGLGALEKGELWWNLHDSLRDTLKREIDIITEKSLKNPYFIKEINETKQLIYGE